MSGGSILAAHLVLNWDRYNGSPNEFDAAASEFLSFVRLDVRNRIVRRFPLALPAARAAPAAGALESQAERARGCWNTTTRSYLYGDTSLFELPERPQLHLLATNLSEGCLCSFNRNGLVMVRRQAGNGVRIDRIHMGLATVAMAVTASSAFPGFFPPLELTGADVGANSGEFGRQAYTDGGVFDNLGVRMFRWLERPLLAESQLARDDFFDFHAVARGPAAGQHVRRGHAAAPARATPRGRRSATGPAAAQRRDSGGRGEPLPSASGQGQRQIRRCPRRGRQSGDGEEWLLARLSHVLRHYQFHRDPLFAGLTPGGPRRGGVAQGRPARPPRP